MREIPQVLHGRAFTIEEAARLGVTERMLAGRRFVRLHRGIYRTRATEPTLELRLRAARQALGPGVAVSHVTNLRLRGFEVGSAGPLHFATNRPGHRRTDG